MIVKSLLKQGALKVSSVDVSNIYGSGRSVRSGGRVGGLKFRFLENLGHFGKNIIATPRLKLSGVPTRLFIF